MDPRIAIWNTLHDGEITVAAREGTALEIFVSIPYLRVRLAPLGDSFSLRLSGLRALEFSYSHETKKTSSLSDIAMSGIVILSTDSNAMPVKVETTQGCLTLDFDEMEIRLDTGQIVAYQTVLSACTEYWDEWSMRAGRASSER